MPWETPSVMEQRIRFLALATAPHAKLAPLCRQFNISRTTGYKWLLRSKGAALIEAVKDQSRRPKLSPHQIALDVEEAIVAMRHRYPYWGARKLMVLLKRQTPELVLPSERTINRVLKRNDLVSPENQHEPATGRYEYAQPNELWQMDYKGEFYYAQDRKCYPLDVLDDHSRFNILLSAHQKLGIETAKESLENAFRLYGLPESMLVDHGTVWYTEHSNQHWTRLSIWLMRLGINLIYARVRHPQTSGKIERFHRTLKYDLLKRQKFGSLPLVQQAFDRFRHEYNHIRPHEALGYQCPADRYRPSSRMFPEVLAKPEYPEGMKVYKLNSCGILCYHGRHHFVSEALASEYVGVEDFGHVTNVYFYNTRIKTFEQKGAAG